jgi:hypothetical protein
MYSVQCTMYWLADDLFDLLKKKLKRSDQVHVILRK